MAESLEIDERLLDYATAHTTPPDDLQRSLIAATRTRTDRAGMQIETAQGTFMEIMVHALRPTFVVEVGTFTGYSALAIARALPEGGRLLCCDLSDEWTAIAREYWETAGVADRIDLRIGPAIDTLRALPDQPTIDLAFIDADKTGYLDYYEELLRRLSSTGLIMVDNVLWDGRVLDPAVVDPDTEALRAFNDHVAHDDRVTVALLPLADGITLVTRRR